MKNCGTQGAVHGAWKIGCPSLFLIMAILVLLPSCLIKEPSRSEFVLGTVCTITLFDQGKEDIYRNVFAKLREIDNLMSVNIPASDISRINTAAGAGAVRVHQDIVSLIWLSFWVTNYTDGAFDISIGPIVNLWGINSGTPRIPSQQEIDDALALVNMRGIDFHREKGKETVTLEKPGMSIDFGGIAKGFAAALAAEMLIDAGIKQAIIDLGGNILIIGENKTQRPWRVGVQNPNKERGSSLGYIQIKGNKSPVQYTCIVTAGSYERFFEEDGKRYHHIFSPYTGYPVDNDLLSVTIIASESSWADALSTAFFVKGYERAIELIEKIKLDLQQEIEAVFVFKDNTVRTTSGVDFTLTDTEFEY